jgi:hypothetical protein
MSTEDTFAVRLSPIEEKLKAIRKLKINADNFICYMINSLLTGGKIKILRYAQNDSEL